MWTDLFFAVLNMSFTGSIVVLVVLLFRLLFKRAPKILSYLLWAVVLVRLAIPVSFFSTISLLPTNPKPFSSDMLYASSPQIHTGLPALDNAVGNSLPAAHFYESINPMQVWAFLGTSLWAVGILVLLLYGLGSAAGLKKRLAGRILCKKNVYEVPGLETPFVLGLFRPKIYLPQGLQEAEKEYILLHEQLHIRRLDHVTRLLSFFVLCIHWFNPLVWVAFFLSGRDMEMACDEAVLRKRGTEIRGEYSRSLLSQAAGGHLPGKMPLAFGKGQVKGRIENILSYKKPLTPVLLLGIAAVVFLSVCLLANPLRYAPQEMNTVYTVKQNVVREAQLTEQYALSPKARLFQTKFRVSDEFQSIRYFVELYRKGTLLGTYVENKVYLTQQEGTIVTAFSVNSGDNGRWSSLTWTVGFGDGGYSTTPAVPFPEKFSPYALALSTLGDNEAPAVVEPDGSIILGAVGFQAEEEIISSYDCAYLMENPQAIGQYECLYLVKAVFSQKAEPLTIGDVAAEPVRTDSKTPE